MNDTTLQLMDHPPRPQAGTIWAMVRYPHGGTLLDRPKWHIELVQAYPLHPSVYKLIESGYIPDDARALGREWPHVSVEVPTMVAYTQSAEKGERNIQTRTKLGRYLRARFSTVPDHVIRDQVARAAVAPVHITHDMDQMVDVVVNGPGSCMADDEWEGGMHPYHVYAPKYGWGLAYTENEGGEQRYASRALVFEGDINGVHHKCFVRTYGSETSEGYTQSCEGLAAALREMGYEKCDGWPQQAWLKRIECDLGLVMPYVDGCVDNVNDCGDHLELVRDGEIAADATCGYVAPAPYVQCDSCEDDITRDEIDSGDAQQVFYENGEPCGYACSGCVWGRYTNALCADGEEHLVLNGGIYQLVDGTPITRTYIDVYGLLRDLWSGDYMEEDDAVWVLGLNGPVHHGHLCHYETVELAVPEERTEWGEFRTYTHAHVNEELRELRDGRWMTQQQWVDALDAGEVSEEDLQSQHTRAA